MDALDRWLAAATADAVRRGLPELTPLLDGLAASTRALRAGAWNDAADRVTARTAGTATGAVTDREA